MKKRLIVPILIFIVLLLASCTKEDTPEQRLKEYIGHWNKAQFTDMYDGYLTIKTKETFDTAKFVDRQKKLSKDLAIKNRKVTYTTTKKDTDWDHKKPAKFKVHIQMDTLAGKVQFDKEVTLHYEKKDKAENWFIEWNPSFIFPELEEKDTIRISTSKSARGEILDRNGKPIASNGIGYEIGIVSGKFTDESKKVELAELLTVTEDYITKQLSQSWVQPEHFVPISRVAKNDDERLEKLISIPGVTYKETAMREYPYGESMAHLTGYIGKMTAELLEKHKKDGYTETDLIGRQGLEKSLESRLRGQNGVGIYIQKPDAGAELLPIVETPAVDGETISVTIDAELQKLAYTAMKGEPGASVAVDPNNGETLVLLSSPSFSPTEFMLGISGDRYKALSEDPLQPLFNRFAAAYAPGSTLKPITAAIGLEAGTLDPAEGLAISGSSWQKDSSWGNYAVSRLHPEAPNPINLNNALIYSDNIYFAQQALKMGRKTFTDGLTKYGFGEDIPFYLNLAPSQLSNDGKISSEGQLADTSFGQGQMLTNILHLATMYEPLLTDGVMYKPTLLAEEEKKQVWKEGLLSSENARLLRTNLRNVITNGYAQAANLPNIPLAGKTGTAELKATTGDRGQENGFFIAYNSEAPTFILAMMIESVEDNNGSGYVAELASEVFKNLQ